MGSVSSRESRVLQAKLFALSTAHNTTMSQDACYDSCDTNYQTTHYWTPPKWLGSIAVSPSEGRLMMIWQLLRVLDKAGGGNARASSVAAMSLKSAQMIGQQKQNQKSVCLSQATFIAPVQMTLSSPSSFLLPLLSFTHSKKWRKMTQENI